MAKTTRRRRWLWLGVLPALVLLAVLGVRTLLQPERLSAFLLRQASQATGLQLTLSQPADVGLWPDLHLELSGLTATAPGATVALLRAERVEAVLPWSALQADALEIRSLRIVQPQLDWAALQAWFATRARRASPLALPRIDAAVEVSGGRVAGADWSIEDLALRLPSLRSGAPTTLTVAGRYVAGARDVSGARGTGFEATVRATPRQLGDGPRFDALDLVISAPVAATLRGSVDLGNQPAITLTGDMPTWPEAWPAVPLPSEAVAAPLRIAFDYRDGAVHTTLARGDEAIEIEVAPGDLSAWLDDPAAPLLPPLTGTARAERLQFGSVELRGVELRVEDDDAQP